MSHRTLIGLLFTIAWLAGTAVYVAFNWQKFLLLEPNAVGDFTAGVFAPLAFLWLVIGYFQQGEELKQNTEALRLQAEELKNSVEQQRELVGAQREQIAFEREAHEAAQSERERSLAPIFTIDTTSSYGQPGEPAYRMYKFRITNAGARVTNIIVSLNGWNYQNSPIYQRSFIESGASDEIGVSVPVNLMHESATLNISYIKASGTFEQQVMSAMPIESRFVFHRLEG